MCFWHSGAIARPAMVLGKDKCINDKRQPVGLPLIIYLTEGLMVWENNF
jgi:hypothetical protein